MFNLLTTQPPYIQKQFTFNLLFPYNVYSIVFHFGDCFKQLQCTLLNISENCIVDVDKRTTSFWWNKQDQNIQIESCGIMNNASELIVGKIIENGNVRVAFLIRKDLSMEECWKDYCGYVAVIFSTISSYFNFNIIRSLTFNYRFTTVLSYCSFISLPLHWI